jgi:NDP-sugar pyrophosphorylase family protein
MQTVILAGGLGTGLGALTRKIPKPMTPAADMPHLEGRNSACAGGYLLAYVG